MSPEEILKDLRDIHLPASMEASGAAAGFAWWPVGLVALTVSVFAVAAWLRRDRWRRAARKRLAEIERDAVPERRLRAVTALVADLARIGRAGRPPDCIHLPPERLGPAEELRIRVHLASVLARRRAAP